MIFRPIVSPIDIGSPKTTIHLNGKLGFNKAAARLLNLSTNMFVAIGRDDENEKKDEMFMKIYPDLRPYSFKVYKAGKYFYINTKSFFEFLGMNYTNQKIIFDLEEVDYDGEIFYKMNKRKIDRK